MRRDVTARSISGVTGVVGRLFLCALLLVVLAAGQVVAQNPSVSHASETLPLLGERTRFIPYSDLKEILESTPRGILLPRDTYESLKAAKEAFVARGPRSPLPRLPQELVWGAAEYRGEIRDEVGIITASFVVDLPNEGWVLVPLPGGDIAFQQILIDGEPAGGIVDRFAGIQDSEAPKNKVALMQQNRRGILVRNRSPRGRRQGQAGDYSLALKGPGRHHLTVRFLVAQVDDPERNELTFRIPRVPINSFAVGIAEARVFGEVDRSEGTVVSDLPGSMTMVAGNLGPTDRFTLRWAPRATGVPRPEEPRPVEGVQETPVSQPVPAAASPTEAVASAPKKIEEPPRLFVDSFALQSFGEGFIRTESLIRLNVTRSPIGIVRFLIPSGTEVLDLRCERMEGWKAETASNGQSLTARLNSRTKGNLEFTLTAETRMTDTSGIVTLPIVRIEGAERDRGSLGLEARTSIEIRRHDSPDGEDAAIASAPATGGISPIDVSELPEEVTLRAVRPLLLAWRYQDPERGANLQVEVVRHKDVQVLTSVIDHVQAVSVVAQDETSVSCLDMKVKNNGGQYLETRLPTDSEIISASLDGAPVKPSSRRPGEYLIPLANSRSVGAALAPFNLRLVYRTGVERLGNWQWLTYPLPALSLPVSRVDWTVYAPEDYQFLPMKSNFDTPQREILFLPFLMASEIAKWLTQPVILLFILILAFVNQVRKSWRTSVEEGETAWGTRFLEFGVVIIVIAVLASVSGPMIGSITDQGKMAAMKAERAAQEFERRQSMESDSRGDYEGAVPAPAPQTMDTFSEEASPLDMGSAKGLREKKMTLAKKPMSSVGGKALSAPRRATAGRQSGALPVEMKLPTGGYPIQVFRNVLPAGEVGEVRALAIWNPFSNLFPVVMGIVGFVLFLLLLWLALGDHTLAAALLFTGYSVAIILLEERLPESQFPGFLVLFAGIALLLLFRLGRIASASMTKKEEKAASTAALLCLLVFRSLVSVSPADADPTTLKEHETVDVYVPYSQLGDRLPKDSPLVFLKYDEYRYLRDLGQPEPDAGRLVPPVSYSVLSGHLDGAVIEDRVELKARFEIDLHGTGFKAIPFPTEELGISSLTLNGEPVVAGPLPPLMTGNTARGGPVDDAQNARQQLVPDLQQQVQQVQQVFQQQMSQQGLQRNTNTFYDPRSVRGPSRDQVIWTDRSGRAVLEARLVKDLYSKNEPRARVDGFRLPLPPFALMKLDLLVQRPGQRIEINPAVGVKTVDDGKTTRASAFLQPCSAVEVEWRDRVATPEPSHETASATLETPVVAKNPKAFVDHQVLVSVGEGVLAVNDQVQVQIEAAPVGEFRFRLPSDLEVIDVTGSDLAAWNVSGGEQGQELVVTLNARRLDQVGFRIEMERQVPQVNGDFGIGMPVLTNIDPEGTIERQKGYLGVESREGLEIRVSQADAATRVDPQELPETIRQQARGFMAHAFKFLQPIAPTIGVTKHQEVAVSTAQIDNAAVRSLITREGKILTRCELTVRNNNNQFLVMDKLPEGMKIHSVMVNHEPVKPGLGKAGETYVPLIRSPRENKAFRPFGVAVIFEQQLPAIGVTGGLALALPGVSLDISEMTWVVDYPDDYFFMKGRGDFTAGKGQWQTLPPRVQIGGQEFSRMANVKSQVALRLESTDLAGAQSEGLLPVVLEIPRTGRSMVFNRTLISTRAEAPTLQLLFLQEHFVRILVLLFALLVAFVACGGIRALVFWSTAGFFGHLLVLVATGGMLALGEGLFGQYLIFLPLFQNAFWQGLLFGLFLAVGWYGLGGKIAAEKG